MGSWTSFCQLSEKKKKRKKSFSICYKIHKGLISPFRYKAIPPEGQMNLSASPLVSVMQVTTYKSGPLCPMALLGVSPVLARISPFTHPSFLSLGDKNCLLLCSGKPYTTSCCRVPLLFSSVAPSTVLCPFPAYCSTTHRTSFWLPCLIMMSM